MPKNAVGKASKSPTRRTRPTPPAQPPKPAPFTPRVPQIGVSWLDDLPLGTAGDADFAFGTERVPFANTRSATEITTLFFRLVAVQPLRSQSLAGNASSAPATDHIAINGVDRFVMFERKPRGAVRSAISRYLRDPAKCTDREMRHGKGQCGRCLVCRLFGFFANNARSRVTFSDFYSEQHYSPTVLGSIATQSGNPFIRTRDMAPPGTAFVGFVQVRRPSRLDLATLIAAMEIAGIEGFGSETTHYGTCKVEVLGIAGGYLTTIASSIDIVEAVNRGLTPDAALRATLDTLPFKRDLQAVVGHEARVAADRLARLSPMHVAYGEELDG